MHHWLLLHFKVYNSALDSLISPSFILGNLLAIQVHKLGDSLKYVHAVVWSSGNRVLDET